MSTNPRRATTQQSLARLIKEKFGENGEKLVEELEKIIVADLTPDNVRMAAIQIALDRGFGKAPQEIVVEAKHAELAPARDLSRLSRDQLVQLAELERLMLPAPRGEEVEVVEVTPLEPLYPTGT